MRGLGNDNLPAALFHEMVRRFATLVGATEAAGFVIAHDVPGDGPTLVPLVHIRPDDSTPELRAAAVHAFSDMVGRCVRQDKDAAFEISGRSSAPPAWGCLVTRLGYPETTFAAMAFIVRCEPLEAERRLRILQGRSQLA
jgi:hypothetical protein